MWLDFKNNGLDNKFNFINAKNKYFIKQFVSKYIVLWIMLSKNLNV